MSTTDRTQQGSLPNDMTHLTLPTQQMGRYVFHDRGYGHYIITEDDRVIEDSHDFTNSEVHQLYAIALKRGLWDKTTCDEMRNRDLDGRVIETSHHPTKSQMDERCRAAGKLVRYTPANSYASTERLYQLTQIGCVT